MVPKDEDRDGSGQYLDLRPEMEVLAAAAVESNAAAHSGLFLNGRQGIKILRFFP